MKRRSFLKSASLATAAAGVPLALASVAKAAEAAPFVLLRAAAAEAGAKFVPVQRADAAACAVETLRVTMDALHLAPGSSLSRFTLDAIFDAPSARAPFTAWHYADGRNSQRLRFVAGRASMRGFQLEYRRAGDAACRTQDCALTRFDAPLLAPGHYVLASADAGFVHSGNVQAPLAAAAGVDYLAFRIEPVA